MTSTVFLSTDYIPARRLSGLEKAPSKSPTTENPMKTPTKTPIKTSYNLLYPYHTCGRSDVTVKDVDYTDPTKFDECAEFCVTRTPFFSWGNQGHCVCFATCNYVISDKDHFTFAYCGTSTISRRACVNIEHVEKNGYCSARKFYIVLGVKQSSIIDFKAPEACAAACLKSFPNGSLFHLGVFSTF